MRQIDLSDNDLLERLKQLLKPFKDVTVLMSSETSPTISLIRPLLSQLMRSVKPDSALEDPAVVHEAKAFIYFDLDSR